MKNYILTPILYVSAVLTFFFLYDLILTWWSLRKNQRRVGRGE